MFAALSLREPLVYDNIATYIALGPVTYVNHGESKAIKLLADSPFAAIIEYLGIQNFLPPNFLTNDWGATLCTYFRSECVQILDDSSHKVFINVPRIAIFLGHAPAGTSSLNMLHWRQMVLQNETVFPMYDYGIQGNIDNYGQPVAPVFDLSNIDIPVHLMVGQYDELATLVDATLLKDNLVGSPNVTFNTYPISHVAFVLGKDMSFMNQVFEILDENTIKYS